MISTSVNATSPFSTEHLRVDLRSRSIRGAAATFRGQAGKFFLQTVSNVVLVRLLTPSDYGLIGMTATVTGFLLIFSNIGLSAAVLQRREIDSRQMNTLFWVTSLIGFLLSMLTIALAPAIAWFYNDPRLTPIAASLGCGFFIAGLGTQHATLLRRQMRFGLLSGIDVVAGLVGLCTGIVMASLKFGYWSLVGMQLSSAVVTSLALWLSCPWRPGSPSRNCGMRSILAFGGNLTIFSVLNYFIRNLDNVLIGWKCGTFELGQYSRAYGLLLLPLGQINAPISSVAVAALSRLQDDPLRFRRYYLKSITLIAYLTMPLTLCLAVFSKEVIMIVMGPQWSSAANLFRILAMSAVFQPILNSTGWLFTSLNRAGEMAHWGYISSPVFVLSFVLGLPWGAKGVAIGYCLALWILTYPCLYFAVRGTPISVEDIGAAIWRPLIMSIAVGAAMFACKLAFTPLGLSRMLVCSALAGIFLVWLFVQAWPSVRTDIYSLATILRNNNAGGPSGHQRER